MMMRDGNLRNAFECENYTLPMDFGPFSHADFLPHKIQSWFSFPRMLFRRDPFDAFKYYLPYPGTLASHVL